MCATGLLFSAATIVVLVAHLGECAAQKSGSLRTSPHHGGESHHDVREEHPSHDDLSSRMDANPSFDELDTTASGYAQHLGKVTRHQHASAAGAQDGDDSTADAALDSQVADEILVGDTGSVDSKFGLTANDANGLEYDKTSVATTDDEADGDSDDSVDVGDSVDAAGKGESSATISSDSTARGSASARLYREAGASHIGQPPAVVPVPIDNVTTTRAPMASTTASTVTGLPGQLPGNDGEITTPEPASEGTDATTMEPGSAPQDISADDPDTEDQAAGNTTGVVGDSTAGENNSTVPSVGNSTAGENNATVPSVGNSTAGDNNSTVVGDWGQEYGDAAQAHDDSVASGGRAASSTATVSAGEGQGSGVSSLVVGFVIILSLIAVALCLGKEL